MDAISNPIFLIAGGETGIHVARDISSINEIYEAIFSELGLLPADYYLTGNGKLINNVEDFSTLHTVHVCPRLLGGKGGFGSMLRAIGAQIEKTTNRDACRDLSGRRLRDINEEQRLKRWFSKQSEREQEKEELRKKKLEKLRKLQEGPELPQMNDPEYFRQRAEIEDAVYEAVDAGFGAAKASTSAAAAAGSDKLEVKDGEVSNSSSSSASGGDSDVKSSISESKSSAGPGPSKRGSDAPANAQPKKKLKKLMLDEDLESDSSDDSSDEDGTKK